VTSCHRFAFAHQRDLALPVELLPQTRELLNHAEVVRTPCGDGQMTWRIWGSGAPVIFLHGAHGSWLHWQNNIAELSRHYRLIVADLPGFGDSDVVLPLDSPVAHAEVLATGLRLLLPDAPAVDVVGFSAGALLGCHMDVLAPDLVRRLIMIDSGGLGTPLRTATFVSLRGLDEAGRREATRKNLAAFMYHDADLIDDAAIIMNSIEPRRMRSKFVEHVIPDKLLHIARQVRAPIDLIWGEFDFPHPDPEGNLAAVRAFQPEAQLRVIERAGHWSIGEQPARFNAALLDLLAMPPRPRLR